MAAFTAIAIGLAVAGGIKAGQAIGKKNAQQPTAPASTIGTPEPPAAPSPYPFALDAASRFRRPSSVASIKTRVRQKAGNPLATAQTAKPTGPPSLLIGGSSTTPGRRPASGY